MYISEKLSKLYVKQDLRPDFLQFLHQCLLCEIRSILPCLLTHVFYANLVNKTLMRLVLIGIKYQFTISCMHCIVPMYLYVFLSIIAMAGFNYHKPKFTWDTIDRLSELDLSLEL